MKICVFGLWHLGCVTAGCLADLGFQVIGLDIDETNILNLSEGKAPIYEPGLKELIKNNIDQGRLQFTTNISDAVREAELIWVTFDTPVDDDDQADINFVDMQMKDLFNHIYDEKKILISSQVPVGFTKKMEEFVNNSSRLNGKITLAYSPENLRLGKSLQVFKQPDRIVMGVRKAEDQQLFEPIIKKITTNIQWMSIESAEMTKHAINSFLALSVTFANELACLCEKVGANAKEVEIGLKTEERIGPKAYLGPGASFAGGTLARDAVFLSRLAETEEVKVDIINAIKTSNDHHKDWSKRKILEHLGDVKGRVIAVFGLTYKPGTDTLRRSLSIELCSWLSEQGAEVKAYDPNIKALPDNYSHMIQLCNCISSCLIDAECAVVTTALMQFKEEIIPENIYQMKNKVIIDASGFIENNFQGNSNILYSAVGRGSQ